MSCLAPTMSRMAGGMDFEEIGWLRSNSPAWRLLRADNAPLVLSFLHRVFVEDNVRSIPAAELASRLDDELYARNERVPHSFPKPARAYLDDWAAPESGWLRKYYPEGSDEPHFDATPAVERALQWVRGLQERDFVGTESRLNTVFDLLRQIVFGTEADPAAKVEELRRQQRTLEDEIARIEAGEATMLDPSGVRDRYQQFAATAQGAARGLPPGRGELPQARPAAAGTGRRLAGRQGGTARRHPRQPGVDHRVRSGPVVPGVPRLPAVAVAAGGAVRPARPGAPAVRQRRQRPQAAARAP